jgi:NAD+ kinase
MRDPIHRVGLVANPEKTHCRPLVRRAATLIARAGRTALTDRVTADFAGVSAPIQRDLRTLAADADLLLVFGGDGTILRIAREIAGSRTPLLGINTGGLGFLTAASSAELALALRAIWKGAFLVENRRLIEATRRSAARLVHQVALNDFVISRSAVTRLIELEVAVDGTVLTHYRCDGLIVSSPTGSTAYSLAAGGAVVSPNAEVMTLTPICPHALSNRSIIVSLRSVLAVTVLSSRVDTVLSADGQTHSLLATGDVVTIRRSRQGVHLVRLAGSSFFDTLRRKLKWSGSNV